MIAGIPRFEAPMFLGEILLTDTEPMQVLRLDKVDHSTVVSSHGTGHHVWRRTLNRFVNDKPFIDNEEFLVAIEGIVLNSHDLMTTYMSPDWGQTVLKMYTKQGDAFFKDFCGTFSGVLFDKREKKWLIFTDHMGVKPIYYARREDRIVFSSLASELARCMQREGMACSLDVDAAYLLLTFGYMVEDYTLCTDIRKIRPGHYLRVVRGLCEMISYYSPYSQEDKTLSEVDAIEGFDTLFRQAVRLEYEKDIEYGYRHIVALSGGLDSRMNVCVAHEMGYIDQLNYTFSQTDYLDEQIAKQIARDLGNSWLFKSLDHGLQLLRFHDATIHLSFGEMAAWRYSNGLSLLNLVDFSCFGIVHSGLLGDVCLGSYLEHPEVGHASLTDKCIRNRLASQQLVSRLGFFDMEKYDSKEQALMVLRGFHGMLSSCLTYGVKTEVAGPFTEINCFNFSMSIPLRYRCGHNLYKKWIVTKHPRAAEYIWENTGQRIVPSSTIVRGWEYYERLRKMVYRSIMHRIGLVDSASRSMNPLDHWYRTNLELRRFMDESYQGSLQLLDGHGQLKDDCMQMYTVGNVQQKNMVLTLLDTIRIFGLT